MPKKRLNGPQRVRLEFTAYTTKEGRIFHESGRLLTLRRMLKAQGGPKALKVLDQWYEHCTEEALSRVEALKVNAC